MSGDIKTKTKEPLAVDLQRGVMPEFVDVTDCTDCPCLSRCHDENNCNLGYETDLLWKEDRNLIYCSPECELISVTFGNEIFEQDKTKATKTRPER